ncbi:MAG: glycosyltransferase [Planctomycetota bacterium]
MKVLFFSYAYPNPLQPGLGTFNRSMIAGLVGDHEVRVVSPVPFPEVWRARLGGKLPRGLNDPQFVAVPGVQVDHPTFYYPPKLFRSQYGQCLWWSVQRRLDRAMREFRPDVVLSYWTHPDGEVAVRMARRHNVPAVAMVGGSDVLLLARTGSRRRAILNVLNRADAVVTVSDHIANTLVSDGIEHDKLRVVRRGVDRTVFSPGNRMISRRGLGLPENRTLLVAVGRLVPVKGFQHLIEACSVLKARGRSFSCCILGDGPLKGELQAQIDRLGLRGTVELKGPQSQPELAEWYRAANMTVLSSLSEGVPNVLLESLACGTPFVATSVGGVPEIADQRHDRLVPAEDPVAMADAIDNQLHTRHEQLPVRNFEPLALRAAARRLGQVLEEARAEHGAIQLQAQFAGGAVSLDKPLPSLGRSAEFCLDRPDFPKTQSTDTTKSARDEDREDTHSPEGAAFARPGNGMFEEEELSRTGEYYAIPPK